MTFILRDISFEYEETADSAGSPLSRCESMKEREQDGISRVQKS